MTKNLPTLGQNQILAHVRVEVEHYEEKSRACEGRQRRFTLISSCDLRTTRRKFHAGCCLFVD